MKKLDILSKICKLTKSSGGTTVNPLTGKFDKSGFVVALKGFTEIVKSDELTEKVIARYISRNREMLESGNVRLGTWENEGQIYLDLSEIYSDKSEALEIGKTRNEIAIFNLDTFEEIFVK